MDRHILINYFTAVVVMTIISVLLYATVQQNYRSAANDPQIQMANDLCRRVQSGKSLDSYFGDSLPLENSLAPFVAIYDVHGLPLRSSGFLNGRPPRIPPGVFEFVKNQGEDRVTWQPQKEVRMAMVVLRGDLSSTAYIAVGRSLYETEIRERNLRYTILIGWCIMLAVLLASGVVHYLIHPRRMAG